MTGWYRGNRDDSWNTHHAPNVMSIMKTRDFVYWLQGFAELLGAETDAPPTPAQWKVIRNHLNLVFKHDIDPTMPDPEGVLQAIHDGAEAGGPVYRC